MIEYPKIESLYDRDETTHRFKIGEFRCPEFEYLYENMWSATEKVDGTNIRVDWNGIDVTLAVGIISSRSPKRPAHCSGISNSYFTARSNSMAPCWAVAAPGRRASRKVRARFMVCESGRGVSANPYEWLGLKVEVAQLHIRRRTSPSSSPPFPSNPWARGAGRTAW